MLDPGEADGGALLALADQPQRRALLEADGVPAALAAGDRDDPGRLVLVLVPLPEGGQRPGLVVGVGADVEDVQVDAAVGEGALHRRQPAEVQGGGAGGESEHGRALQEATAGESAGGGDGGDGCGRGGEGMGRHGS